jgi:hypothetical protein
MEKLIEMKKIIYPLISALLLLVVFNACKKVNDNFDGLDQMASPTHVANLEYTLTDADYGTISNAAKAIATTDEETAAAKAIGNELALNATFGAADYAPGILNSMYYSFDKNSSVMLTYNYDEGVNPDLVNYTSAGSYELTDDDYDSFGGLVAAIKYFVPSLMPEDAIPDVLSAQIADPVADQLLLVSYRYSDTEPANSGPKPITHISNDFQSYLNYDPITLDGWSSIETEGTRAWQARIFGENGYAQYSSYNSGETNVSYLVSPTVDLSGSEQNTFSFDVNVGYWKHDGLAVFISEDYDGSDFAGATWVDITSNFTIPTEPTSGYGDFPSAGSLDLSAYKGEITLAFRYTGDGNTGETTTYQIDNVLVEGITYLNTKQAAVEDYQVYNAYYKFDGTSWKKATGVYALSASDYESMGTAYGQPGKYHNFSSSSAPENYLPTFLSGLYPYGQEGDKVIVSYKYYSGGTSTRADEYVFTAGMWTKVTGIIQKSEQFVFTGNEWVFDPTVHITMTKDDYQMIVDQVAADANLAQYVTYGNTESYYGASSYYGNFDIRINKRDGQADYDAAADKTAYMLSQMAKGINIWLGLKFPDAVPEVKGISVHYIVSAAVYDGLSTSYYDTEFDCTASGTPPTFELVSGPSKQ